MNHIQIKTIAEKIREKFHPDKIILFGSRAYGNPAESSDIDLLVIMRTNLKFYRQAALIRLALDETFGVQVPMDIIVRTPEEIEKRIQFGDFFMKKILEYGVAL